MRLFSSFKRAHSPANDNEAETAYFSDIASLTRDFGDGGTYEEHHFCTVVPASGGRFNVHAYIGGKAGSDRLGEAGHLLASGMEAGEAAATAEAHLQATIRRYPAGTERGETMRLKGHAPLERGTFDWQPVAGLVAPAAPKQGLAL